MIVRIPHEGVRMLAILWKRSFLNIGRGSLGNILEL